MQPDMAAWWLAGGGLLVVVCLRKTRRVQRCKPMTMIWVLIVHSTHAMSSEHPGILSQKSSSGMVQEAHTTSAMQTCLKSAQQRQLTAGYAREKQADAYLQLSIGGCSLLGTGYLGVQHGCRVLCALQPANTGDVS